MKVQSASMSRPGRRNSTIQVLRLTPLFLFLAGGLFAQGNLSAVRGTVRDHAGTPVTGAAVSATHFETGERRTTQSDAEGQFEIRALVPGLYVLEVSHDRFAPPSRKHLALEANQNIPLDFSLVAASRSEGPNTQEARRNAAGSSATSAKLITESQLVGLPLNGRSYSQLATLQAGVSDPASESASRGGGGGSLTVAGGRSSSNNFLLDGTNIMNTDNRVPRSAAGVQLGSDAVYQVQVFSPQFGPEYGRGNGGVLNSITRSGTDEFHGTFFEYLRNSKLDARNFFDPGAEPPPFKRNQFGFTLSGPFRKTRTYFMVSFEGLRDRLTETSVDFFPDAQSRQGIITDAQGNVTQTLTVHPSVKPYLALYPLPNGPSLGRGIGENRASQFLPTDENFATFRVDHQLTERDSLFARYTFDDATSETSQQHVLFTQLNKTRQQYLTFAESHIFSPQVLTAFRFGFTRPRGAVESLSAIEIPRSLFFVPSAPQFGQIFHPGMTPFGPNSTTPEKSVMNSFQFSGDLFAQKGIHALKLGWEIHRYRWHVFSSSNKSAVWRFNGLESMLLAGARKDASLTVALPGSDNTKNYLQTLAGFYFQDTYAPHPRLQINMGLRYEFATLIRDKDGKTVFLPDPVRDSAVQAGPYLASNPSLRNFSPRLGFSWSPWGQRSTVFSGGFGIYYDQLLAYVVDARKDSPPFYNTVLRKNFDGSRTFPDAVLGATEESTPLLAQVLDYRNANSPMVLRYNISVEQVVPEGLRLRATYVGARGNHLFRNYEANLFPLPVKQADGSLYFPPHSGPVNPAFGGGINVLSADGQSFYNSLQVSASKSLRQKLSLQASYTFSKSVDDASGTTGRTQYGLLRTLERGLSDYDIRHRLTINYFYTFPTAAGSGGWKSRLLTHVFGDWRLGGIISYRSGIPLTAQVNVPDPAYLFAPDRPNLVAGQSNNPTKGVSAGCGRVKAGQKLGGADQYFDPCAFEAPPPGTLGNLGRNTIIGPNLFSMDVSLQKEFRLDARRGLQFRAEIFNLLNRTNLGQVGPGSYYVLTGFPPRRNATAGTIQETATTSRQAQFALRFSF